MRMYMTILCYSKLRFRKPFGQRFEFIEGSVETGTISCGTSRGEVVPNLQLLANALDQQGLWSGQKLDVTGEWFLDAMKNQIEEIDWLTARKDVERFVVSREQASLEAWSRDLFLQQLDVLAEVLRFGRV